MYIKKKLHGQDDFFTDEEVTQNKDMETTKKLIRFQYSKLVYYGFVDTAEKQYVYVNIFHIKQKKNSFISSDSWIKKLLYILYHNPRTKF